MQIRLGTLAEAAQVVQEIGEFIRKETVETLAQRLAGKRDLILIAEEDGQLLGFKIGYELDSETFYSWFGGVSSLARNRGVAQQLLDAQEQLVAEQGYGKLTVKSRNQFPAMLRLLLRNGYLIENFEKTEPLAESRIHFVKHFLN
ncbi:GNAT family N-acetyltransferase [Vibrio fluvialis]|uniref:GNAT family N-acetyltransferase n=1 Tax=Vibrio fluvialis TaxID=676 RepID=UPI001C9C2E93|nr:GNAT family N-acetyltransferase [Vibrio fluvialis]MBY7838765.1 GNAT family N-acetyltransferase [Vibrio fluvialis]MBY8112567.1 GNAT family N-acetyltransferase [Vibrio fluvialis]MBY8295840.1 GNAT family N-acetyltransferase [Vibrio fluvialis]MBY8312598.1 GNAT family N-acetyltransferase [Vibrio fluvialis]MCE7640638.1 GNAT family N-acetyltransferase [Vibrio fluvialis]